MRRPPAIVLEEDIQKLKSELAEVRYGVLQMVHDDFALLLTGYYECKERRDVWNWINGAIAKVIESVEPRPAREMGEHGSSNVRALCPLCGESATNFYGARGFAYPEGLSRHLHGSFNATQCFVTKVATDLALSHVAEIAEGPQLHFAPDPPRTRRGK